MAFVMLGACGLSALTLDPSFIILGVLVLALFPLTAVSVGELAMAGPKEKRTGSPGRRQKDHELWALAKAAFEKAAQADTAISRHIAVCEEQNRTIIEKLTTQDKWREADVSFQRKLFVGALSALALLLAQIVGKATGLL
ncbi:hypothetical protein [Sphingomonas sp.]|uniref:hypothetical protein n=1 Tax=Sphingomonas sp. TaxID=28214 RepID=UPI00356782E1